MNDKYFEDLYLRIIDQFPNPIWRAGLDTKCDFFNKAWLEFTGRKMEQEVGDGWVEGVHKDDLDACVKTYLDSFKVHKPFSMKYRLKHNDGTYHWLLDSGAPFFDDDDKFLGYIGSCYDINDDENSKQEKDLYDIVVNAINDGVWDWNVPTGLANFSSRYYEMLGYKDNEFPATYKHWITLVHPDDVKRVEAELQIGVKSGETFIVDVRLKKKDGSWFWTETRGKTIATSKDGSAIRMVGTLTDITDRKQIEEKLENLRLELQNKYDESKKLNDLMVDRELKMVEMKNTIKEMQGETP